MLLEHLGEPYRRCMSETGRLLPGLQQANETAAVIGAFNISRVTINTADR